MRYQMAASGLVWLVFGVATAYGQTVADPGSAVDANGMGLQIGGGFVKDGTPALFFGITKREKAVTFAYLVVAKGAADARIERARPDRTKMDVGAMFRATGGDGVKAGNALFQFDFDFAVDRDTGAVKELLKVGDKELDFAQGRLLLVDLTGDKAAWRQLKVALPDAALGGNFIARDAVPDAAVKITKLLADNSAEVRKLVGDLSATVTPAKGEKLITRLSAAQLEEILKAEGWKYEKQGEGIYLFKSQGLNLMVRTREQNMGAWAVFALDEPPSLTKLNEWNNKKAFARAYLNDKNQAIVDCDLLVVGGVTEANIREWLRLFTDQVRAFQQHLSQK
jgi:hypothetical protein